MILVDTNVISQFTRISPEHSVIAWLEARDGELLISTVAFGEMAFGISRLPSGRRKASLRLRLDALHDHFEDYIVPFGILEAEAYANIMAQAIRQGAPMSIPDGMIAATAHVRGIPLATRNTKDFQTTGLTLINPWSPVSL